MAIRRGALPCSLGSSPQGSSATISPLAQSRSAARASDWPAPEWWQRQPRPPQDVTRQHHRQGQNFKPPEECTAAARARIPQLEAALAALGNTGLEVVALQQALKKARTDAKGMPLATQLKECQLFVERKEKKIASIDQERMHEMKLLEEGTARLERLRKEVEILQQGPQIAPQIPANISGDVQKLQAMVAQLQSEKEEWSKKKDSPRLPEDFVCASDEDLIRWLGDRQQDMNDALMAGNAGEVARMVVLVNEGTNQLGNLVQKGVACVRPWWGTSSGESEVEVGIPQVWVFRLSSWRGFEPRTCPDSSGKAGGTRSIDGQRENTS